MLVCVCHGETVGGRVYLVPLRNYFLSAYNVSTQRLSYQSWGGELTAAIGQLRFRLRVPSIPPAFALIKME